MPETKRTTPERAGIEITPEIPEIASKNTIILAVIVYLPENLAGRNYFQFQFNSIQNIYCQVNNTRQ